ncbi:DUF7344 domain-containing protein [Natrinema salifodinae]|uniref:DUF7344 domain-containing protein n=1 Tax=Natrinema salifodinae TaxID=1202768 RepID=A0A1I0MHV0_9EURY|nr:hypothetical protein [Natrinema salifodinae]SEV87638.1 hypothetical protein SAMN05216285_0961 [Natrinema salifodinae]
MPLNSAHPSNSSGGASSESPSDEPPELSQGEIFHILQTNRRRDAIRYLLDREDPVKMRDIAEVIAANEHETTVAELTSTQRQRVYIPLYQKHLPKLDEKGIIEYNKSRGIVRPTDQLEIFRPYLEIAGRSDSDDRSDTDPAPSLLKRAVGDYYVMAIGASSSLLAASVIGLVPITGRFLATVILILFTLATAAATFPASPSSEEPDETSPTTLTYHE